jgi:hypothetical protein
VTAVRVDPPKTLAKSLAGGTAGVVVRDASLISSADSNWPLQARCAQSFVCFDRISRFHLDAMVLTGLVSSLAEEHA